MHVLDDASKLFLQKKNRSGKISVTSRFNKKRKKILQVWYARISAKQIMDRIYES